MLFFRTILGLRTTLLSKVVRNRRLSCVLVYRRQYCASSIPLVNVMVVYYSVDLKIMIDEVTNVSVFV